MRNRETLLLRLSILNSPLFQAAHDTSTTRHSEFCFNDVVLIRSYSSVLVNTYFYTKIVLTLRHKKIQVQSSVSQGQKSQAIYALNVAPYKR